jgi:hypothetical protein
VLFVQCKAYGELGPEKWNDLYALATNHGAVPLLAERPGRAIVYWRLLAPKDGRRGVAEPRGAYQPEHG